MCEFGSTDGSLVAAAWESGMDNAIRFDNAKMIKNNDNAWSMNQESVDLNVYLYCDKIYLSEMAMILQKEVETKKWLTEAATLKDKINNRFYDSTTDYYYDTSLKGKLLTESMGPEGWLPLWANIPSQEQSKKILNIILQESVFNTFVPLPTIMVNHKKFDPLKGYWRGPVWLDQFYFCVEGLKKYGYTNEANMLIVKLLNNGEGIMNNQPLRENYHPINGMGLNAINFSWSAAHILLMLHSL